MAKRTTKFQEFIAHTSNVNCVQIGPKSGQVFASGGEDKVVNIWRAGQPQCVVSLTNHASAVEALCFDQEELTLASACTSGSVRLWDLETGKVSRTFAGHRAAAVAVDFHPFGSYFASGGVDSTVKIWDIKGKKELVAFKGHEAPISVIKFTPDGRWIVSGDEAGVVKVWDLSASKMIKELKHHDQAITCAAFSPEEFVLVTGSADRTLRFWEFDRFVCLGATDVDSTRIRCVRFSPDGKYVFSGSQENLKVWQFEPRLECLDTVEVGWQRVSDMYCHGDRLMSVSFAQSAVQVWLTPIAKLSPWNGQAKRGATPAEGARPSSSSAPIPPQSAPIPSSQQPRPAASVVPPIAQPSSLPPVPLDRPLLPRESSVQHQPSSSSAFQPHHHPVLPSAASSPALLSMHHQQQQQQQQQQNEFPIQRHSSQPASSFATRPHSSDGRPAVAASEAAQHPRRAAGGEQVIISPTPAEDALSPSGRVIPAERNAPVGLNLANMAPKAPKEEVSVNELKRDHVPSVNLLQFRVMNVRTLVRLWSNGDYRSVLERLALFNDIHISSDVLSRVCTAEHVGLFTLDLSLQAIPLLKQILSAPYEDLAIPASKCGSILFKTFSPMVRQNLEQASNSSVGVDLSKEDRIEKCRRFVRLFSELRPLLEPFARRESTAGEMCRELLRSLSELPRV